MPSIDPAPGWSMGWTCYWASTGFPVPMAEPGNMEVRLAEGRVGEGKMGWGKAGDGRAHGQTDSGKGVVPESSNWARS